MNIFVLDEDPELAAKYHCDKHCVKMILESAQMLSLAHRIHNSRVKDYVYGITHKNHPCSKWVCMTSENYEWCFKLFNHLLEEYTRRYQKTHKCSSLLIFLKLNPCPAGELTEFAQAMPEELRCNDTVKAYRRYYREVKKSFAIWKTGEIPYWF